MSQQATMLFAINKSFAITRGLHTTQTVAPARNFSMYAPSKASYALIELLANRGFDHFVFQPFSYMYRIATWFVCIVLSTTSSVSTRSLTTAMEMCRLSYNRNAQKHILPAAQKKSSIKYRTRPTQVPPLFFTRAPSSLRSTYYPSLWP